MNGDRPETLLIFVFLEHARSNAVGDPLAVRAEIGLRDIANLEIVVDGDIAWSRRSSGGSGLRRSFLGESGKRQNQSESR